MRLVALLVLCLTVCANAASAATQAPACPPYSKAIVLDFKTQTPAPTYNRNLNVAGIRNLFLTRGQSSGGPHSRALGITAIETMLSLRASSRLVPQQNGYCVYLTSVDADFGWQKLQVFVASELKQGGCGYNAVLDHENQHVAINRETVAQYAPLIRARIEESLRAQKPIFTQNTGGTTDAILEGVKNQAGTVIDQFGSTLSQRQGVIDTASNYSATSALCRDWGDTPK